MSEGMILVQDIRALQFLPGLNAKKAFMESKVKDDNFKQFLYFSLNPMMSYNISDATINMYHSKYDNMYHPDMDQDNSIDVFFSWCMKLSVMNGVSNSVLDELFIFLNNLPVDECNLYLELLSKKVRLGITATTVNKIFKDLIPIWEVQQAFNIQDNPIREGTEFWLTQKLNGTRATFYNGKLYSRNGSVYVGLDHIINELPKDNYVYDGELTLVNKGDLSDNEAFRKSTGIVNSNN